MQPTAALALIPNRESPPSIQNFHVAVISTEIGLLH